MRLAEFLQFRFSLFAGEGRHLVTFMTRWRLDSLRTMA
jgi:hypothetical protein